jgi:hypothetical protein
MGPYLTKIEEFLDEKKPKYDIMVNNLIKLPEISLSKDISMLNSLLIYARQSLNAAVQLYRNSDMLQSLVKSELTDLEYIMAEKKIESLTDPNWIKENLVPKMSKEERDLKAQLYHKDLSTAIHKLTCFSFEVDSLKRAVYNKKEDLERVRKDLGAMIWGVRTEELLNNKIAEIDPEKVKKFLSTGIKDMDDYLNMNKRR